MPTATFFNLPKEKKNKLIAAIREELARVPFEKVSINKIVQAAKIPRGSFYQYFAGKQDMLEYILAEYRAVMFSVAKDSLRKTGGDLFSMFADLFGFALGFVAEPQVNAFCRNIFSDARSNMCLFDRRSLEKLLSILKYEIFPSVDLKALKLRGEAEIGLVFELLAATTRDSIAEAFLDAGQVENARTRFFAKLDMLKNLLAR